MVHLSPSDVHPTDADLIERILSREAEPHAAICRSCSDRFVRLSRELDPAADSEVGFDEMFFRVQAASIRTRIESGEGRKPAWLAFPTPAFPRMVWASAAAALLVVTALQLQSPAPPEAGVGVPPVSSANAASVAVPGASAKQDVTDDSLLREIDQILDDDPYDLGSARS